jgi:tRNA modification GTPase
MGEADLILALKDCTDSGDFPTVPEDRAVLYVLTKSDLLEDRSDDSGLWISTKTGQDFDSLTKRISDEVSFQTAGSLHLAPVRARQVSYLKETIEKIEETSSSEHLPLELRSELLRRASHSLGKITGAVDVEDLLGVIFAEFCIGK